VNEWVPGLFDEGLQRRLIICGPSSLYVQVRTVWEAWQNFYYEQAIAEIVKAIDGFRQDFQRFKERFQEVGDRIQRAAEKYEEIASVSFKRLEQRFQKIEEHRRGQPSGAGGPEVLPMKADEALLDDRAAMAGGVEERVG
jgi:DNA anti-recombination protein RmuC